MLSVSRSGYYEWLSRPESISQVVKDKFGKPLRVMFARLGMGHDLVGDDFRHGIVAVVFEQECVANLVKGCAHRFNMRRIDDKA